MEIKYVRERICVDCGKVDIIRKDSKAVRCRHCSGKIGGQAERLNSEKNKYIAVCAQCGENFYPRRSENRKYCSVQCFNNKIKAEKLKRVCKQCGEVFEIYASVLKTNASGNFCSRGCYEEWMSDADYTGGRGSRWKRIRRGVIKATPFCALCGATNRLEVHHIAPYRLTMDNSKENLIPLCKKCHTKFEYITRDVIRAGCTNEYIKLILGNILETYKLAHLACLRSI